MRKKNRRVTNMRIDQAQKARDEKGEKIRRKILEALFEPSTSYQLSKMIRKNPSTIRYHLKKLEENQMVLSRRTTIEGRSQTIYYLADMDMGIEDELVLPVSGFVPKSDVFVYALSAHTIGVATREIPDWERKSLWKGKLNIENRQNRYRVKVPKKIAEFYPGPLGLISATTSPEKDIALFIF